MSKQGFSCMNLGDKTVISRFHVDPRLHSQPGV